MKLPQLIRKSGTGLASQVLNSGSNLLLSIVVAREVMAADYGGWAIGYSLFVILLALNRAVVSTPVLIQQDQDADIGGNIRDSVSAAAGLGLCAGTVLALTGLLWGGPLGAAMVALGVFMPGLLVHDTLRYGSFKEGRPGRAVVLDLVWVVGQGSLFAGLLWTGEASVFTLTAAWGAGASAGACVGLVRRRLLPRWRSLVRHVSANRWHGPRLLVDSVFTTVAANALPTVVGAIVGLTAAGYLRAGQTLMGIVGLVVMGLTPIMTVEAVRMLGQGQSAWRIMWGWSAVVAALGTLLGSVVLTLPDQFGEQLLGDSWAGAHVVLVPLVLQTILRGPFTGVPMLLKAASRLNELVRLRVRTSIATLAIPSIGAVLLGLPGAAWGLAVASVWADFQSIRALKKASVGGCLRHEVPSEDSVSER